MMELPASATANLAKRRAPGEEVSSNEEITHLVKSDSDLCDMDDKSNKKRISLDKNLEPSEVLKLNQ